jgi:hypothetical protein
MNAMREPLPSTISPPRETIETIGVSFTFFLLFRSTLFEEKHLLPLMKKYCDADPFNAFNVPV